MKTNAMKWACALALTLWAGTAAAQQNCEESSDCPDGQFCAVSVSIACPGGPDGADEQDCVETREGVCEAVPDGIVQCEEQADCPEYLTCLAPPLDSGCVATRDDPDGEDCEPEAPAPDARKFCVFVPAPCMADADCPDAFSCEPADCDAPVIGCEGEDCPDPEEDPCAGEPGQCLPTPVVCQDDAMCPDEWVCVALERSRCDEGDSASSSGSTGSAPSSGDGAGAPPEGDPPPQGEPDEDPVPEPDPAPEGEGEAEEGVPPEDDEPHGRVPAPEDDDCEDEIIRRNCLPPSLAAYHRAVAGAEGRNRSNDDGNAFGSPGGGTEEGAGGTAAGGDGGGDDDDSAGCGCDATAGAPPWGTLGLLAFLACLPLGWRRRR